MRICIYTESALPMLGGQELTVDALAREYGRLGHDVVVLAPSPRSSFREGDDKLPYPVRRHPRFISTWRGIELYAMFLRRLHRRWPFDIMHCHNVYPTAYVAVVARAKTGVPVVVTSHGDLAESNPVMTKPRVREKCAWTLEHADALVAISGFTREGYRRLLQTDRPIHDIPNGVRYDLFCRPVARPADLDPRIRKGEYFLFLGRLIRRKGADVLLEALALVDTAVRPTVIFAGLGVEQEPLQRTVARLGLSASVIFVAEVRGETKTYLLQNSIATVIPSRDWEAFPLVVLESFAAGRPVIATQVGGLKELIVNGRNGWLVDAESPGALAGALRTAADDRAATELLGRAAQHEAERADWALVARQYLALFDAVLTAKRSHAQGTAAR